MAEDKFLRALLPSKDCKMKIVRGVFGGGTEKPCEHLSSYRKGDYPKAGFCSGHVGGISRPGPLFGGN